MAGQYWRVTMYGNGGGSNVQTVLHFIKNEAVTTGEQVAALLRVNLIDFARTRIVSAGFVWTGVKVEALGGATESPYLTGWNHAGAGGTGLLPLQVAVVWNLFTGGVGRRRRGRIFWPAPPLGHIGTGILNATGVAQHDSVKAQMLNYFCGGANSTGLRLAVRSRANDEEYEVTSIAVTSVFGTLSTRRVGVGF